MKKLGSRLQVFRGTAVQTSGGLKKSQLVKNQKGKIVSKKKQQQAKQQSNLAKYLVSKGRKAIRKVPKARRKPDEEEELLDLTVDSTPRKRKIKKRAKKDPLAQYRADQKRRVAVQAKQASDATDRKKRLRKLRAEQKQLRKLPSKAAKQKLTKKELAKLKAAGRKIGPSMFARRRVR